MYEQQRRELDELTPRLCQFALDLNAAGYSHLAIGMAYMKESVRIFRLMGGKLDRITATVETLWRAVGREEKKEN